MLATITVSIDDAKNITVEGEGFEMMSMSLLQKVERQIRLKAHQVKRRAIHEINAKEVSKVSEEVIEDVPTVPEKEDSPETKSILATLGLISEE